MVALSTLFTDYLKPGGPQALRAAWHLATWSKSITAILGAYSFLPPFRTFVNGAGYGAFNLITSTPVRLALAVGGAVASASMYGLSKQSEKPENTSMWQGVLLASALLFSWQIYDLRAFRWFANNSLTTWAFTSISNNIQSYATNQLPLIGWGAWIAMYFAREEAKEATEGKELHWVEDVNLGKANLFEMPEVKWGEVIQEFQQLYNDPTFAKGKDTFNNLCSLLGNRTFALQAAAVVISAASGNVVGGLMLASGVSGLGSAPNLLWSATQFIGLLHTPLAYAAGLTYSYELNTMRGALLFLAQLTSTCYLPYVGAAISGVSIAISVGTFIHSYWAADKQPNLAPTPEIAP
jgi:hypothetical protein